MTWPIPHEEYTIKVHSPMDERPCCHSELCGNQSHFNLFVENDRGDIVVDQHLCQEHLLTEITNVVLFGPPKQRCDEIVSGLPRSRWQQFDASKDYLE